jgi:small-conductance mechanosensitive channel
MAIKRRLRDGTIKLVTFNEDKDQRIKRLEALLKELTETLAEVMGYDKLVAGVSTYDCYK